MEKQEFIEKYTPVVLQATSGTRLFPSVMMAQAALESGWGRSKLASLYNNLFGIKADPSWKGEKVVLSTGEYLQGIWQNVKDAFRVYSDPVLSFRDRVKFLEENPRYRAVFEAQTPEEQARALQNAGYATDPKYATKLIATIHANEFKELDIKKKS